MSDLPPNIDAILSSIRSRMNDDGAPPVEPPAPPIILVAPDVPLESLSAVEIAGPSSQTLTLEGLMRTMLEPMLKAWLDANMPEIVEKMAQSEIKRLTGRD